MMKMKLPSEWSGGRTARAAVRCECCGSKRSPAGSRMSAACRAATSAAAAQSGRGCRLPKSLCTAGVAGGISALWARSAGIALAFAMFASALLGSASVWSQSQSAPMLSFAATPTFAIEGGDDIELHIELLLSHVSSRVDMVLTGSGTAILGVDYSIVAAAPEQGIMLGDGSASMIGLRVDSAPAEPLRLLLRPRAADGVSQGDRVLQLRLSSYRAMSPDGVYTETIAELPQAVLELTIRDDEAPTAQQLQLGVDGDFSCFLLPGGSLLCAGDNTDGRATPPAGLAQVAQLAVGRDHSCAVTVSGQLRCWGADGVGQSSPPEELGPSGYLGPVAQVSVGDVHSCALTVFGQVHCWGYNGDGRSSPPDDLRPVTQLGVGNVHSCVLTVADQVHCWGYDGDGRSSPPDDLGAVAQLAVGPAHSCALTASGRVRCWGSNHQNQATPPADLDSVAQLVMGDFHSCALTAFGRVRCWGGDGQGQATPPDDLGAVVQLAAGNLHSCALAASGQLRCWGAEVDISLLPPIVAAIDASGVCALLSEGSVLCPGRPELVPPELRPGEVVMSVLPQQLNPGQRAAIRFDDLGGDSVAFIARIEIIGDDEADVSGAYRLVDSNGMVLVAEGDGSYLLGGVAPQSAGNSPMVWLEALAIAQPVRLYVRPLELLPLSGSGSPPSIRQGAQPVELGSAPFLAATADILAEGAEGAQLSIWLPPAHTGLRVELELTLSGTARVNADYILSATDLEQGIMFGGDANPLLTLRVESAPAEPLRLLLRQRADDPIYQGNRSLNLRLSRYRVVPEGEGTVALPQALGFTIVDDEEEEEEEERLSVQQLQVRRNGNFACVLFSDDAVRCGGNDTHGRATPPEDLPPVAQLGVGNDYACALTISGELHCWGNDADGRSSPPQELGPFAQLAVGVDYSCALTVAGELHCWGSDTDGRSSPPEDLGPFAQLAVGESHSCAVTVAGQVHCWGADGGGKSSPPMSLGLVAQVAVGAFHSCAVTISGEIRCWGSNFLNILASPGDSLGPFAEVAVGRLHSCALTVAGLVHCWGFDSGAGAGRATPPEDLGPVTQLLLGELHSCAVTAAGVQRCWGNPEIDISSLPPGSVTAIDASGMCAFLAEGSVVCPDDPQLLPSELAGDDVVMEVLPQRLNLGERAAIRFTDLRKTAAAFTARIEILGGGDADVSSYYRLFDSNGQPLDLEEDANSALVAGNSAQLTGNPPMFWLEALAAGRGSRLYVRPLELLSASGSPLSISMAAHPVELIAGPFLTASTDTVTEGEEEAELSILLPLTHIGQQVELELIASGNAMVGRDYTLVVADLAQGIMLSGEESSTITLRVASAPTEALRLLLRSRADNSIVQGDPRLLNLRISRYRVMPEIAGPADLPPALDFTFLDDEPLTAQQIQVEPHDNTRFACVLLNNGSLRCAGSNSDGQSTPPDDLPPVAQFSLSARYGCAVTVAGRVRCWGRNDFGQATPPDDLEPVAQVRTHEEHSCALTVSGQVHCWGDDLFGRATPPVDLDTVAQLAVGTRHSCAVTVSGQLRCWGTNDDGESTPPEGLGPVAQLAVGRTHSCAVTVSGEVRCWGESANGQTSPPDSLGPDGTLGAVAQVGVGRFHSCALTVGGEVHCWGDIFLVDGRVLFRPPEDLGPVVQLSVGYEHACALTVSRGLRCWGKVIELSSLPPGAVATADAVDSRGRCALLADGSMVCPGRSQLVPAGLGPSDVVMAVWPQQLRPGQRAAIRFADLGGSAKAFTARIEVVSEGTADISSYYRLLDRNGRPVDAEPDGSYLIGGGAPDPLSVAGIPPQLAGNSPMAWLQATGVNRSSLLYVSTIELRREFSSAPSIRMLARSIELVDGLFLGASTDMPVEGGEAAQINIWLPLAHGGRQLELELAVSGDALADTDYTLAVANPAQGIVLSGEATDEITLRVASAPTSATEPLRLLLRPRAADRISQGARFLTLRLSRYQVDSEAVVPADLPPALDLTIVDDEPPTAQQITGDEGRSVVCVLLNNGSVRCAGNNGEGESTPPNDLEPAVQLRTGSLHSCALTVEGRVRCWGFDGDGRATPPDDLDPVVQLAVYAGGGHTCALTVLGEVHCWGANTHEQSSPPNNLSRVTQLGVGHVHSCALTVSGEVHCWGEGSLDRTTPPVGLGPVAQLAVGRDHNCAVTVLGELHCWGNSGSGQATPPDGLGPDGALGRVAQVGLGDFHSCALTASGQVRCWGAGDFGQSSPPADLPTVTQLAVGRNHTCALTVGGRLRCWGKVIELSSLPPGSVTAVAAAGICALLADGSLYCPDRSQLVPDGLAPSDVVMAVWPRRLLPGQRAAIRFADLRGSSAAAFTARIEVFGEDAADVSSDYRLLDRNGRPVDAETDGSYLVTVSPATSGGYPWLQATGVNRSSLLYVRPLELLSASGSAPSIRKVVQSVELVDGLFLGASTATVTEGGEAAQIGIWLPLVEAGLPLELELAVGGNALEDADYTLVAANSAQGIVLGGEANSTITLLVTSAPTDPAEPLRLLLRPRADDRISQGARFLTLRISRYQFDSETAVPAALDFTLTDDEPPTAQQIRVEQSFNFSLACVLLNNGSLRCMGGNSEGQASPPDDLGPVVQFGYGFNYSCALTVGGEVRCWGSNFEGQATPPDDLGPVAQLAVGVDRSCALTVGGEVRCWGDDADGRTTPPDDLGSVAQVVLGSNFSCARTVSGRVRCWGDDTDGRTTPPEDLGSVVQLGVGDFHSCALTASGRLRCWGTDDDGQSTPPAGLGPDGALGAVAQIGVGRVHSCALTVAGEVHCWGSNFEGQSTPPDDLGLVEQLTVGFEHSCARTVSGRVRCWGKVIDVSSLPPGAVATADAVDFRGHCALLADGSLYCPDNPQLVPSELRPSDVAMAVWPRQLLPGQRAAIRFADLRDPTKAFTARIEVFGEGTADISSDYRLLDRDGRPVDAEPDGSYLIEGGEDPDSPPMAWLQATGANRSSLLYVRPLELLPASGSAPSIHKVAQSVELVAGLSLAASTDTPVEGGEAVQIGIWLPLAAAGLPLELELTVGGSALEDTDYTLVVADLAQGIVLDGKANSTITLQVASAPTSATEPLRLLLRTRADDLISQGNRLLTLQISRYQVDSETAGPADLPRALDLTIVDDEPLTVQQIAGAANGSFVCVLLNGGSVRCVGSNGEGESTPPTDLEPIVQLRSHDLHTCALTVEGRVRCWGFAGDGRTTPPDDLPPIVQVGVGRDYSCALTVSGRVRCWGNNVFGRATPPDGLGRVAQLKVGNEHTCALTVSGQVRCWGEDVDGQSTPPEDLGPVAQVAVGNEHTCALTVSGEVRCWGRGGSGQVTTPPDGLGPDGALGRVAQIGLGNRHSCALTVGGEVHCWGTPVVNNRFQDPNPPDNLGPFAQLMVGRHHTCALTVSRGLRCWGAVIDISSLPPGAVTAVTFSGVCALLAEGSVYCPSKQGLIPDGLAPSDVAMSLLPQQLLPGERAAIRFADLRDPTGDFTVRIEVIGEGTEDVSGYYRLFDSNGMTLEAEEDGRYSLTGDAWLEALGDGRGSILYVRPLEPADSALFIRELPQPIELSDGAFLSASAATLAEGGEETEISIWLPLADIGADLRVELELTASGTALLGSDYTLAVAAPSGVVLGRKGTDRITLTVEPPVPNAPLRLRLQTRADDLIRQGDRFLALRISRYRVISAVGKEETADLPPVLNFTLEDDEPPTGQQVQVGPGDFFSCVLANGGSVLCGGSNSRGRATPPADLEQVVQLALGRRHACALTVSGRVRCWGRDDDGQSTPPLIPEAVMQLSVGDEHSCALTVAGRVYCWGHNTDGQATPPAALSPVVQLGLGNFHSCALTASGRLSCWGRDGDDQSSPPSPAGMDLFAQLAVGNEHSCALTVSGRVHCWGLADDDQTTPPDGLGPDGVLGAVVQLGLGESHSCALTVLGAVHCWGADSVGQASPPDDEHPDGALGPVAQLSVGRNHSCAQTVAGELRCWGVSADFSSLSPGLVTAIDASGRCALLADGSLYCPSRTGLASLELRRVRDEVVMSVLPPRLLPEERAAIRFSILGELIGAFTARIEVFGEGTADVGSAYRLLDVDGTTPLVAEAEVDGRYRYQLQGNPPLAWLEAMPAGRGSLLYVRPLPSASGSDPSIRELAQPVELIDVPLFSASADTLPEGGEEAELSILLPPVHAGRRVELELTVGGTARAGADYTLAAAASQQGIVLSGEATDEIMLLLVESAPTAPVRLRLQSRSADSISQGERLLNLRISRYRVISAVGGVISDSAIGEAVALPPALDFTLLDDDLETAQQIQVGGDGAFACVLLDGGSVRCVGDDGDDVRTMPPDDLAAVAQLAVGDFHSCALTVLGEVHCWGLDEDGQSSPPGGLGPDGALGRAAQIGVGDSHSCALTVAGQVHCWGFNGSPPDGRATPPADLGPPDPVAQLGLGDDYSCALTVGGKVHCWGANNAGQSSPTVSVEPFVQLAVGASHSCALTVGGEVHCWGANNAGQSSPTVSVEPFVQLAVGASHSCALTVGGRVHCWGSDEGGRSEPPEPPELDPFAQLMVGDNHGCARTVSGQLLCWGDLVDISELPVGAVTAVDASGGCALLLGGSVYCRIDSVPSELLPGEVVMSVWPRQLQPGERAAIRFSELDGTGVEARIEVFGDGAADVSSYYRLFDSDGTTLLDAEPDGSYRIEEEGAWLEATVAGRFSRLYVRPLGLIGTSLSIRKAAQPVELGAGQIFTPTTDTVTEGADDVEWSILLPPAHEGLPLALELAVSGTALAGADYTLVAADPAQGIVLGGEPNSTITLSVESAPAERLRLLLQIRADDSVSQGPRLLNLRISGYPVAPESGGPADLATALELTILDDEPPMVTVQQIEAIERSQFGDSGGYACALLNDGSLRCVGSAASSRAPPPEDLGPVAQLAVDETHSCALTVSGQLRCWGDNNFGQATPPVDIGSIAQLVEGFRYTCALTVGGEVHCWGLNADGQASPPNNLGPVAQLSLGEEHGCALTVSGQVRCWGNNGQNEFRVTGRPADNLGPFIQLSVREKHSCALTEQGAVYCWGQNLEGQASPPNDLPPVVQIGTGAFHSCALTAGGEVYCWGIGGDVGPYAPPADLGPVAQLSVGYTHACALTVSGRLRCWGQVIDILSLPPGAVAAADAVDYRGHCAILVDGSVVCPNNRGLFPPELRSGDVMMSVSPQQLLPGQRAAIRFADLGGSAEAFTARIEVIGYGDADVSNNYRLLSSNGTPVEAEDGSYELTGNPPMAWLEATGVSRSSRLYVRPTGLSAAGADPSIRMVAQPVELVDGLFLSVSSDTVTEGGEEAQINIWLPLAAAGLPLELELAVGGDALADTDYTLAAAQGQGIVLGGEANSTITLSVASAPMSPAEPLRLLLRPRADDSIRQGDRFLTLRISRYQLDSETGATVDLPAVLDLTIVDDESPTVQQIQVGGTSFRHFTCALLSDGSLRCAGSNTDGRITPPDDLGPVAQLAVSEQHSCAVAVSGRVRCWGTDIVGSTMPPEELGPDGELGPVAQVGVGMNFSCALTVAGELRCWGANRVRAANLSMHQQLGPEDGRVEPPDELGPDELGPVAQLAVSEQHSCALTVSGLVRCWGSADADRSTSPPDNLSPFTQLSVGQSHNCALTASGLVHCWGLIKSAGLPGDPPGNLGPIAQLISGNGYSCVVTVLGELRCWGGDPDFTSPPAELGPDGALGPVAQLAGNGQYSCALTVSGQVRCWGSFVPDDVPSLPPGSVTAISVSGRCMVLADGSVYCFSGFAVPPELRSGDVAMSVSPQQLQPGQRAAIRFADLRDTTGVFTARIEVFGEGDADVSSYYRLLSSAGTLLVAEEDANSVLLEGNPPMAWLEYLGTAHPSLLYVLPVELLSASGSPPSIRTVAQPVELLAAPFLSVSTDTLTEGDEQTQISIWLPEEHIGLPLDLELTVGGTVLAGSDYTLAVANPAQGIDLSGEATDEITLRVESAPAEPLRLLLRPRANDRISQGTRFLILRLSRYQVTPETGEPVDLPPALDITIVDDEPPTAQRIQLEPSDSTRFACVLLNDGSLRCAGNNDDGQTMPPDDLGPVVQLGVGTRYGCALTVAGRVRCWGFDGLAEGGRVTPPDDLPPIAQLAVTDEYSCALTVGGEVRCWGFDTDGELMPPGDLDTVALLAVGARHSCAVTVSGALRCWGQFVGTDNNRGRNWPPDDLGPDGDLGPVAQVVVGRDHNCAVTVEGELRCWGLTGNGQSTPPAGLGPDGALGPVAQVGVGDLHSCALTELGAVHCWGAFSLGQQDPTPPDNLGPATQLMVGKDHACALTVSRGLRCWGTVIELSSLPPGAVTAVDYVGRCALLADGSVYCPGRSQLVPSGLGPSDVVMAVWPQQLLPGQRAAIRIAAVAGSTETFTARIEVVGEGTADVSSYYRLLDSDGQPLEAGNSPNSPQLAGNSLTGNPPMAWLEATGANRSSRLYVRPLSAFGITSSTRVVAQSVELVEGLFLRASTDTVTEGDEEVQIDIWLPLAWVGLPLELELAVIGSALAGTDYTLAVANPAQGIDLSGEATDEITLRVASAPTSATEPLRLLLRPRADDLISQGDRSLQLQVSRYQVTPETGEPADLPPPLALTILDDEPPTAQQITGDADSNFVCVLLNGGGVRCAGSNGNGESTPPNDLEPVVQLRSGTQSVANFFYTCALTVSGRVRCWGSNFQGQTTPPEDALGPFVQLALGHEHNCALTAAGEVHCWGFNGDGKATPPADLGAVAQVGVGELHSCALTVLGRVRCWGFNGNDGLTASPADALGPFTQLVVGDNHSCALTNLGAVRCWGRNGDDQSTPPDDLGPVAQIGVGDNHSCALTVAGEVRCWGQFRLSNQGPTPPDNLGPVVQLIVGNSHTCALTVSQGLRCWGSTVLVEDPILPPGAVTAVHFSGVCALLAEGSVYCPDNPELVPDGLAPSDGSMAVWPRQLVPGQRAAIHFADLRDPPKISLRGSRYLARVLRMSAVPTGCWTETAGLPWKRGRTATMNSLEIRRWSGWNR